MAPSPTHVWPSYKAQTRSLQKQKLHRTAINGSQPIASDPASHHRSLAFHALNLSERIFNSHQLRKLSHRLDWYSLGFGTRPRAGERALSLIYDKQSHSLVAMELWRGCEMWMWMWATVAPCEHSSKTRPSVQMPTEMAESPIALLESHVSI